MPVSACRLALPFIFAAIARALLYILFQQMGVGFEEGLNRSASLPHYLKPGEQAAIQFGFANRRCGREAAGAVFAQQRSRQRQQPLIAAIGQLHTNGIEQFEQPPLLKFLAAPARNLILQQVSVQNDALRNSDQQRMGRREVIKQTGMRRDNNRCRFNALLGATDEAVSLAPVEATLVGGSGMVSSGWNALDTGGDALPGVHFLRQHG